MDCSKVSIITPSVVQNVNTIYFINPDQFIEVITAYGIENFNPINPNSITGTSSSSSTSTSQIAPTQNYELGYYENIAYETAQLVSELPSALVNECLTQLYQEPKLVNSLQEYYKVAKILPIVVATIKPKILTINNNNFMSQVPAVMKKYMYVE